MQDFSLAYICELRIDILLIQESCFSERTKTHPYYDFHLSFGSDKIWYRAAIFMN